MISPRFRRVVRAQLLLLAGLAQLLLIAAGCGGGPGSFCSNDGDCHSGLRCISHGAARGVCSYPPSNDLDISKRDARLPEGRTVEARMPEARTVEARMPEARLVDKASSRESLPDRPPTDRLASRN